MKVIIFGATGMVGQGVLRECLQDAAITKVLVVGRTSTKIQHEKLSELLMENMWEYKTVESNLTGFDACFFCMGVSIGEVSAIDYEKLNYDLPLAAATTLAKVNPKMTFNYISGAGTDSTEKGKTTWARIKGKTENALLKLPFKAYMFRPGIIQAVNGETSKTKSYRILYPILKPIIPLIKMVAPQSIVTTEQMGKAMIAVVQNGYPKRILEIRDILQACKF